jgi:hypothetical protein
MEIIDGYRRSDAIKEIGLDEIDVFICDVEPTIKERITRNMHRKKTTMDEINDIKSIFTMYPKRQGQRKLENKYSRSEEISRALNNRWTDESSLKKLEHVINNDFENHFLSKKIIEKITGVEPCYEFLKENKNIDINNNYGYTEKMLTGEISVSDANKFIKQTHFLDKTFEPTFSIPERCNMYLQDCREVQRLSDYLNTVDVLATSIPYYQLENYIVGGENQIGHEETKEEYADNITDIINKQIPLLKDSANVFLNISETYQDGIALGIPFLIQEYISKKTPLKYKGTIYFSKKNPKPESEKVKRSGNAVEHVHWFVLDPKKAKYQHLTYLKNDGWRGEITTGAKDVDKNGKQSKKSKSIKKPYKKFLNHLYEQQVEDIVKTKIGANHDILKIKSEGHPCPFNPLLVLNLILMSTERDDSALIYDCFSGGSICGQVATLLNKRYLGVELNKTYYDIGCEILVQANKSLDHESLKELNDFVYQTSEVYEIPKAA